MANSTPAYDPDDAPRLTGTPYDRAPLWAASTSPRPMPVELPPRAPVTSARFSTRIDDIKSVGESGLSAPAEELLALMVSVAAPEVAGNPELMAQLHESALLIETGHASVADLADAVRRGPEIRPTPLGDLIGLNTRLLSPMIAWDIANIRGEARHGASARRAPLRLVPPVSGERDTDAGERCLVVRGAEHFSALDNKQNEALGFTGTWILDGRNRADLESLGSQGVLKPLTIAVTRITDGVSGAAPVLSAINGSRRTAMAHWAYDRILPDLGAKDLAFRHMTDGFGNITRFASFTEDDAIDRRELLRAAIADFAADGPSGNPAADAVRLASWAAGLSGEQQVLVRLLTVPAFVIIGVDLGSVPRDITNPMTECIKAYTNSLHVKQQSDLEWEEKAIWLDVARRILRRVDGRFGQVGGWVNSLLFEPDSFEWRSGELASTASPEIATKVDRKWRERASAAELAEVAETSVVPLTLIDDLAPALDTGEEAFQTKLEVMLAATATMVCRGTRETDRIVSEELASRGLPNNPKQRGQVWAAAVLGMVGLPLEGTESARVHAALSRTPTHSDVWQLSSNEDPLGEFDNWTELIGGMKFLDLLERADAEAEAIAKARRNPAEDFGPAQIILALAAAYAMIVNPALINDEVHQLTLSGLGHRHGPVASEPMVVALNLAKDSEGRRQLLEMIVALVKDDGPALPRSVRYDPERRANTRHEGDEYRYGVALTEYDLRGSTFWADRVDDDGTLRDVPIGALTANERFFKEMANRMGEFSRRCKEIADPSRATVVDPELNADADEYRGSVTRAFLRTGVDIAVANSVKSSIDAIEDVVRDGRLIRIREEGEGSDA